MLYLSTFTFLAETSFAQTEEDAETKYQTTEAAKVTKEITPTQASKTDNKWSVGINMSAFQGFDNNSSLDSSRRDDTFTEGTFSLDTDYKISDDSRLKLRYDAADITYWHYTDASLLDNATGAGFEKDLSDNLIFYIGYEFEDLYYPNNEFGNYLGNSGEISLKHIINKTLYQKAGFEYLNKGYSETRARDAAGNKTHHRGDNRYTGKYEIGARFEKFMIKLKNTYYSNDSNDKYMDYYDYNSYKTAITVIYLITKRCYAYANSGYEFKDYNDRTVLDKDEKQNDNVWTLNCSLLYELTKSVSMGVNYSYRQNSSNDDALEYAGGLVSAGLYYTF